MTSGTSISHQEFQSMKCTSWQWIWMYKELISWNGITPDVVSRNKHIYSKSEVKLIPCHSINIHQGL